MSHTACAPTKKLIASPLQGRPNAPAYRPDIDGLRAIAVSAVLLFHARFGLTGGFVGVDIFFVISGFLITSLILKEAESREGFSILKFWERRIRRILPALITVIVTTVIAGWFILLPSHFQSLGSSVIAQAVFAVNFYFWRYSGYFAEAASRLPLLHTWSLAVEEQFYIFFPLLFLFQSKWKISSLRWVVGLSAIASLSLSIACTYLTPSAGFYLLPPRAWELLGGSLLALAPRKLNIPLWARELLGWSGLVAVGAAFWLYDDRTPFPGVAALLPCVGTMVLIWVNGVALQPTTLVRLLSIRPLVFLGKISYSLYLWHWPILVYAWYWHEGPTLSLLLRVELLALSLVLAASSWKFVETPFRIRRFLPLRRDIFIFGASVPACCALVGAALILTHGMPSRFPESILQYDVSSGDKVWYPKPSVVLNSTLDAAQHGAFPSAGKTDGALQCLVWGDSHGMALFSVFDKLAVDSVCNVKFATHSATCPILDCTNPFVLGIELDTKSWNQSVLEYVRRERIPNVVLVARWPAYLKKVKSDPEKRELAEKLKATVIALREAGAKVWILKSVPEQPGDLRMSMMRFLLHRGSGVIGCSKANYIKSSDLENEMLAPAASNGAVILDPFPIFFSNRETSLVESSGRLFYLDDNHVSPYGAMLLADLLRPTLTK
jgi:peptidoglycan/LPS O-acetylase OafA/YrhL